MRTLLRTLALCAALLGLNQPAAAQSYYFPTAESSGQARNPDRTFEFQGFAALNVASGTDVASSASANTKSTSWVAIGGPTTSAWSSITLTLRASGNVRYLLDLSTNNSTANLVSDLLFSNQTSATTVISLPLKVAAGTTIYAKVQSSSTSQTVNLAITGTVANAFDPPGFTSLAKILAPDTGNTRGNASVNAVASSTAPAFIPAATTAAAYGGLLFVVSEGTAGPSTNDSFMIELAKGSSGSEVIIQKHLLTVAATGTMFPRNVAPVLPLAVPSSTPLSYRVWNVAAGNDGYNVRAAIYGFVP